MPDQPDSPLQWRIAETLTDAANVLKIVADADRWNTVARARKAAEAAELPVAEVFRDADGPVSRVAERLSATCRRYAAWHFASDGPAADWQTVLSTLADEMAVLYFALSVGAGDGPKADAVAAELDNITRLIPDHPLSY